jgi:hypothetical protein
MHDAALLKIGRHFRLSDRTKLILGRNKEENERLRHLRRDQDLLLEPRSFVGPSSLLIGTADNNEVEIAVNIMAVHAKTPDFPVTVALNDRLGTPFIDRRAVDLDRLRI